MPRFTAIEERWNAGYRDMETAVRLSNADTACVEGGVTVSVW
jgi:hypothetical protein